MSKWTPAKISSLKGERILPAVTAYDFLTGKIADEAGIPLILVGDSLCTTALGFSSTIPATMEIMLHHTSAVSRAAVNSMVVADMPFLSYQISDEEAIHNAGRFIREGGADAVKLEGGVIRAGLIRKLTDNGIPVMAHIGLLPQSVKAQGYSSKGKTEKEAQLLHDDARAVAEAGAFCVVLECVDPDVASSITSELPIPTIGIGAGAGCDGQILVIADMLGLTQGKTPKFVKRFAECKQIAVDAVRMYMAEVEARTYPGPEHTYSRKPAEAGEQPYGTAGRMD